MAWTPCLLACATAPFWCTLPPHWRDLPRGSHARPTEHCCLAFYHRPHHLRTGTTTARNDLAACTPPRCAALPSPPPTPARRAPLPIPQLPHLTLLVLLGSWGTWVGCSYATCLVYSTFRRHRCPFRPFLTHTRGGSTTACSLPRLRWDTTARTPPPPATAFGCGALLPRHHRPAPRVYFWDAPPAP